MHRVQKLLSNWGYCSRRQAEELIEQGKVKVNGKVISLGDKASEDDTITVSGKKIGPKRKIYIMLHKPLKYVTALKDPYHKTIMELIHIKERIFPIGRLDYNSTGLLLLTNDGDFANQIMHPRYEVKKTYVATIDKPLTEKDQRRLINGVILEDGKTSPAKVKVLESTVVEITIHEGKNRIIRRMLKALGYKTRALKRTKIGKLSLGNLQEGKYRDLTKKEKESF